MDCQSVEQKEMIEQYLAGKLAPDEVEAFEQHYLGCQRCFDELQFHHAAAIELRSKRAASTPTGAAPETPWRKWALAAAAVLLLTLASVAVLNRRQHVEVVREAPPQRDGRQQMIAALAAVEPPAYVRPTLRGGSQSVASERFQEGMKRYEKRDYSSATRLLEEAVGLKPDLQPALFYLGVCQLITDQPDEAIATLSSLVRNEESPYLEESHWFLAKAFLKKLDLASARKELEVVIKLNGTHLSDARKSLEAVRRITSP